MKNVKNAKSLAKGSLLAGLIMLASACVVRRARSTTRATTIPITIGTIMSIGGMSAVSTTTTADDPFSPSRWAAAHLLG